MTVGYQHLSSPPHKDASNINCHKYLNLNLRCRHIFLPGEMGTAGTFDVLLLFTKNIYSSGILVIHRSELLDQWNNKSTLSPSYFLINFREQKNFSSKTDVLLLTQEQTNSHCPWPECLFLLTTWNPKRQGRSGRQWAWLFGL